MHEHMLGLLFIARFSFSTEVDPIQNKLALSKSTVQVCVGYSSFIRDMGLLESYVAKC